MSKKTQVTLKLAALALAIGAIGNAQAANCPAYSATQVYNGGDYTISAGQAFRAKWWVQGTTPNAADQWGPWEARPMSECTTGGDTGGDTGGSGLPGGVPVPTPTVGKHLGSYFSQWGIYGRNYRVKNLVTSGGDKKLTFLNYAFGNIYSDGKCNIIYKTETGNGDGGDPFADYSKSFSAAESVSGKADAWDQKLRGNFNQLKQLKMKNPNLKVMISLGGWTWSKNISNASLTDASRKALVTSCINLYIKGNLPAYDGAGGAGAAAGVFDGIDIDWEYPGGGGLATNSVSPNDKANFTALMKEFRTQLDALGATNKRSYYLTAAIGSGVDKIRNTDPAAYSQYMDWINVMTYDFHGGWETTGPTNFHANTYADPKSPATGDAVKYTINDSVAALVAAGMPKSKIIVGVPFYGRGWKGVVAGPNKDGLYQAATGAAVGTYEAGFDDYKVLSKKTATRYVHPVTKQLYSYDGNEFWSYDDAAMITSKANYVKSNGLGGIFSWSLDGDDTSGTLLNASATVRQ